MLQESQNKKEVVKSYPKTRYLYNDLVNYNSDYFIGITGLRGIGKTILLLQLFDKKKKLFIFLQIQYICLNIIFMIFLNF